MAGVERAREVLSRRRFLERAGLSTLAVALGQLPSALESKGLLEVARAQGPDMTADTLSGLVAFVFPGDDEYSVAQGESAPGPGGIAAGGVAALSAGLDAFVPAGALGSAGLTVPASGGVATLLNRYAAETNPGANRGGFQSHFARLSFAEKAEVMQRFEADPNWAGTEFRFVAGILPGFVAFTAFSEAGVFDAAERRLTARPVAWELARYAGPAEGHRQLRGYWKGHRRARRSARVRRWERA